ncbi:ArsR/SmtB family transcription factor [Bacillus sp. MN7755]
MRNPIHPNTKDIILEQILYALSDSNRLAIVDCLNQVEEITCNQIETSVAKSTLSHHVKVLRESGIINVIPKGRKRYLSLRKEELNMKFPLLLETILCSYTSKIDNKRENPHSNTF